MIRPEADEVHISCTFTWDRSAAIRLAQAWHQYYPKVILGGSVFEQPENHFTPGMYIKKGITITSRGCNNNCPWCLVPEREGRLKPIEIEPGYDIQDNNFLQCPRSHLEVTFAMLRAQPRAARFSGGLDTRLVSDYVAELLETICIDEIFLACDTEEAIRPLRKAMKKLSWLPRRKLRCYVLIAHNGQTVSQARDRLEEVWETGCLPFAQLYQPPDKYIEYPKEWTDLNRTWERPAAMFALHKEKNEGGN